jgi:hypothetical protein
MHRLIWLWYFPPFFPRVRIYIFFFFFFVLTFSYFPCCIVLSSFLVCFSPLLPFCPAFLVTFLSLFLSNCYCLSFSLFFCVSVPLYSLFPFMFYVHQHFSLVLSLFPGVSIFLLCLFASFSLFPY